MPTKYDLFKIMYEQGGALTAQYFVKFFKRTNSEHSTYYKMLQKLEKDSLISKNKGKFQVIRSKKTELLYQIINYCLHNGINYNLLLDKNLVDFISKAFVKKKIKFKDFNLNTRTFSKYLEILSRSGFLIMLSRRPLEATLPYNSFLGDLLGYFGYKKVYTPKIKDDEYLEEIKSELKNFKRLKKKNENKYDKIVKEYELRFIQHSLNLEGNPITLSETISLLKENIVPKDMALKDVEEVKNYREAVNLMIREAEMKEELTIESILNYHFIAMKHTHFAGKIRKIPVYIKNNPDFKVAKIEKIDKKLRELLERYHDFVIKRRRKVEEILDFATYFHNEFQGIHPFQDGNSRITRLLTFHILIFFDIPILDIPLGILEDYVFSTKGAKKRDDKRTKQVLQKAILYNLKTINEQLK